MDPDAELIAAFGEGDLEAAHRALAAGANPNSRVDGYPLLCTAAGRPGIDAVGLLLKHGADPNLRDEHEQMTPAMFAALSGDPSAPLVIQALHDAGANLDARTPGGRSALDIAVHQGQDPLIVMIHTLGGRGSRASLVVADRLADPRRHRNN